ncbi:NAD(P)-dependent oxidoreductase [Seohaeicola zhoushanensis]
MVTHTPGVLNEEVADLAIGLLLSTVRRIPQAWDFARSGHWGSHEFPLSPSLQGRRVGLLGLGGIGRAIARRCEGFGVEIDYHTRRAVPDVPYRHTGPSRVRARDRRAGRVRSRRGRHAWPDR